MPTKNVVFMDRQDESVIKCRAAMDEARVAGLRSAAEAGMRDVAEGRFTVFGTRTDVAEHLANRTETILSDSTKRIAR